jgi:hypothetical protein
MQITNNANLPEPLYQAIVAQQQQHSVGEADISCTQLIDAPLIGWMGRNYGEQVVEDAADRLWALYGSIAHSILAGYAGPGHHVETEAIAVVDGMRVSGHLDLLVMPDGTIQDYKFTSAWTVGEAKKQGKPEWERQLNVYRYLLEQDARLSFSPVRRLEIVAMLRDWGPRHAQDGLKPVEVLSIPLWEQERVEAYLRERVRLHQAAFAKAIPPQCSPEERWATPTTYAIVRPGRKTAVRVFQDKTEAEAWQQQSPTDAIEVRPGENKRCLNYCPFGKQLFCPYVAG